MFVPMDAVPEPVHPPTARMLELLEIYLDNGKFQVSVQGVEGLQAPAA